MFQGNPWSFRNQDYFWREITGWFRRHKKNQTCKSVISCTITGKKGGVRRTWTTFLWHLLGKSSTVAHGWLGQSTSQLCKGLSKREQDTLWTSTNPHHISWLSPDSKDIHLSPALPRSPHRLYSLGFWEGSAFSSCPWGTNLTWSSQVRSTYEKPFRYSSGDQAVLKNLVPADGQDHLWNFGCQCPTQIRTNNNK